MKTLPNFCFIMAKTSLSFLLEKLPQRLYVVHDHANVEVWDGLGLSAADYEFGWRIVEKIWY
jgi:hypothetical protein